MSAITRGRRCGAKAHNPGLGGSTPPPAILRDALLAALSTFGALLAWGAVLALIGG